MPALTIKNIPDTLYQKLKYTAGQHQRSINSEVIICLQNIFFPQKISAEQTLSNIQKLRSQVLANKVSPEEINQAISDSRP